MYFGCAQMKRRHLDAMGVKWRWSGDRVIIEPEEVKKLVRIFRARQGKKIMSRQKAERLDQYYRQAQRKAGFQE